MNFLDGLKDDHRHLSSKLAVLESALEIGTPAWFAIRETCFSVSKQLYQHTKRETRVVAACYREFGRIGSGEFDRLALEHHDACQRLQGMSELLWGEPCFSLDGIAPSLSHVMTTVRHQMNEQEEQLFPFLELVSNFQSVFGKDARSDPAWMADTMTVEQVSRRYPSTRAVFEQLHVNELFERYETLAEVAWCHGLHSRTFRVRLEKAIRSE